MPLPALHVVGDERENPTMPYKDPEKQRAAVREAQRRRRSAGKTRCHTPLPELAELRFATASDVVRLLNGEVENLLAEEALAAIERSRAVGYLAGLLLRAIEVGSIEARVEALEKQMAEPTAA